MTFNITKAKTTKELMESLKKLYENPTTSHKVFLMKHLVNMKMVEDGSIVDHLISMVISQISSINVNFDEENRALLIYFSLLERWNGLVMVVSNSLFGSNTIKFDDVIGVILSQETCRKTLGGSGSVLNIGK